MNANLGVTSPEWLRELESILGLLPKDLCIVSRSSRNGQTFALAVNYDGREFPRWLEANWPYGYLKHAYVPALIGSLKFLRDKFPEELKDRLKEVGYQNLAAFFKKLEFLAVALRGQEKVKFETISLDGLAPDAIAEALFEPFEGWSWDRLRIRVAMAVVCQRLGIDSSQTSKIMTLNRIEARESGASNVNNNVPGEDELLGEH